MVQKSKNKAAVSRVEKKPYQLNRPDHIAAFSKVLAKFIKDAKLSTLIKDKEYVNVDGWKFAGTSFGLIAIVTEPERIDEGKTVYYLYENYTVMINKMPVEKERVFYSGTNKEVVESIKAKRSPSRIMVTELFRYKCSCDIISLSTREKVGYGFAICSNAESAKAGFDEFAIASMSQTRAIGKAYRNQIGFLMKSAGFADTPAEEMEDHKYANGQTSDPTTTDEHSIDETTQYVVKECKTVEDLDFVWKKNQHLKNNKGFRAALNNRRKEILAASVSFKNDMP